jgi:hypothetical protein
LPKKLYNMKERVKTLIIWIKLFTIEKIEEAIKCYNEAILLFKSQIDLAPKEKQGVFQMFLKDYEEKCEQLK